MGCRELHLDSARVAEVKLAERALDTIRCPAPGTPQATTKDWWIVRMIAGVPLCPPTPRHQDAHPSQAASRKLESEAGRPATARKEDY
jgi:hypothetical protein